jgi:hypothetical protein
LNGESNISFKREEQGFCAMILIILFLASAFEDRLNNDANSETHFLKYLSRWQPLLVTPNMKLAPLKKVKLFNLLLFPSFCNNYYCFAILLGGENPRKHEVTGLERSLNQY